MGLRKHNKHHTVKVHYVVAQVFHGRRPEGLVIDHIDNDKTNNRPENLRYITTKQNIRRSSYVQQRKKCASWNVAVDEKGYKAYKSFSGKKHYLGWFKTEAEASKAVALCKTIDDVARVYKPRKLSSKTVGVSLHKKSGRWRAYLGHNHLGWFDTEQEAIQARQKATA